MTWQTENSAFYSRQDLADPALEGTWPRTLTPHSALLAILGS